MKNTQKTKASREDCGLMKIKKKQLRSSIIETSVYYLISCAFCLFAVHIVKNDHWAFSILPQLLSLRALYSFVKSLENSLDIRREIRGLKRHFSWGGAAAEIN